MSYATKEQLQSLMADIASKVHIPTIGVGGGYAPIGTIIAYMGTTAPQDYLACDGSVHNIADYPQLADFIETQFGSKDYFGGDGVTTFGVPDLQGEFLRGTGTNSHENQGDGANVGEHQNATGFPPYYVAKTGNQIKLGIRYPTNISSYSQIINTDIQVNPTSGDTNYAVTSALDTNTASAKSVIIGSRPTNTSVLYCIKAVVAGDVYSTDERVVGTWIDGKPIYQKYIPFTMPSITDLTNTDSDVNVNSLNIDNLIDIFGNLPYGTTSIVSLNSAWQIINASSGNRATYFIRAQFRPNDNVIRFTSNSNSFGNKSGYAVIRYTKTTD